MLAIAKNRSPPFVHPFWSLLHEVKCIGQQEKYYVYLWRKTAD